jgi:hypothetical protein
MSHQNAIIVMLAIISIAALAGVFSVQVADAQLPRLDVSGQGVRFQTEEFGVGAFSEGDVEFATEEFGLNADTIGVGVVTEDIFLGIDPLGEVDLATEEFALGADRSGVSIIPNPER